MATNPELIDYQFKVMNEKLEAYQEYTKGEFRELHNKLDKFIESADGKYATKEQHKKNEERIAELESDKKAIIKWIIVSFIGIILVLTGLSKYFL